MGKRVFSIALLEIILLSFLGCFQVQVGKEYAQGFSNNLGELTNYINPIEKSKLYKLYKEIYDIEEKKLEDGVGERTEREEDLKFKFNESLNKLTEKYKNKFLNEDENDEIQGIDEIEESETVDEEDVELKENREAVVNDLKDYVSKEDYESIMSIVKRFNEGEDFDYESDMYNLLKKYTELDAQMIIYQITEPLEIKGIFKINEDFTISYKPVKGVTPEKVSEDVIKECDVLWSKVNEIIPQSQLKFFDDFIVFTDGQYDTLAYVQINEKDLSKYELSIDYNDVDNEGDEFIVTVIHEFGHVLTTNGKEVEYTEKVDPNYYYEEGYLLAKDNSYLNEFYRRYWSDIYEDLLVTGKMEDPEEAKNYFYMRHSNDFATQYCSTSPAEDIAESFALFVLEDKPKGNTVPDQKIRFFYEFDEFMKIRKEIREKLEI